MSRRQIWEQVLRVIPADEVRELAAVLVTGITMTICAIWLLLSPKSDAPFVVLAAVVGLRLIWEIIRAVRWWTDPRPSKPLPSPDKP
jgi:hypothetical protein